MRRIVVYLTGGAAALGVLYVAMKGKPSAGRQSPLSASTTSSTTAPIFSQTAAGPSSRVLYKGMSPRNPFIPPHMEIKPKEPSKPVSEFSVTGILPSEANPIAVLRNLKTNEVVTVSAGDKLDGGETTVLSISDNEVKIKQKKDVISLKLYP